MALYHCIFPVFLSAHSTMGFPFSNLWKCDASKALYYYGHLLHAIATEYNAISCIIPLYMQRDKKMAVRIKM